MPVVTGPMMSLSASGTLGGILTFSQWKSRFYVRMRVDPYNPKSAYQDGIRDSFTWGVLYFTKGAYVTAASKTWWNTYGEAESPPVSGWNRFQRAFVALNFDGGTGTFIYAGIPAAA